MCLDSAKLSKGGSLDYIRETIKGVDGFTGLHWPGSRPSRLKKTNAPQGSASVTYNTREYNRDLME